jgi:hypothetical protein
MQLSAAAGGRTPNSRQNPKAPKPQNPAALRAAHIAPPTPASALFPHGVVPKRKKPRQPRRERLEIPPDVWEKCEACGHTDIREKFERNFNVCPNCDNHRRIRAHEYCAILVDDGTIEEIDVDFAID